MNRIAIELHFSQPCCVFYGSALRAAKQPYFSDACRDCRIAGNITGVATNGTVNLNIVRGVNPAGPWRIADLVAVVGSDGHIRVTGRGLLLAAGNSIGTNAGASVHATLFCGPAATATAFDEVGVALEPDGDFRIDDFLTGSGPLPSPCENPVLLIRNGAVPGQGVWFAAGIPKVEEEHSTE